MEPYMQEEPEEARIFVSPLFVVREELRPTTHNPTIGIVCLVRDVAFGEGFLVCGVY